MHSCYGVILAFAFIWLLLYFNGSRVEIFVIDTFWLLYLVRIIDLTRAFHEEWSMLCRKYSFLGSTWDYHTSGTIELTFSYRVRLLLFLVYFSCIVLFMDFEFCNWGGVFLHNTCVCSFLWLYWRVCIFHRVILYLRCGISITVEYFYIQSFNFHLTLVII